MHSKIQIFLQSTDPHVRSGFLTLNRSQFQTLHHLKHSLLPNSQTLSSSFYFTLNGKPLSDSTSLLNSQITPLSTLVLRSRLHGGGGDGGATGAESRDCYLNMYAEKKPDKIDPHEQRLSKWMNCALSNEPLCEPCVIDRLGNIFNKQALVEALLGKKLPREFGYIKGLKDMVKIQLLKVPGKESGFQCPISGLEFNGKNRFFAIKTCGHVLSAKALKEVKSSSCLVCHEGFTETDKIVINGSEEEVAMLRENMEEEKTKLKEKKQKKVKNGKVVVNGEESLALGLDSDSDLARLSGKKRGPDVKAVEMFSGKVEANEKGANSGVAVKGVNNGAVKRFKAVDVAPANATKEVYASIFTSSRKSNFKETYSCRSLPLGRN